MRLIAAAGIVWFHAQAPGHAFSYSALSLFIVFLIVLPMQRPLTGTLSTFAFERADRLLRPWLIWSAIFAVSKIAQALFQDRAITSEFEWAMLVVGTHIHLWFLPFGFICSIAAFIIARSTQCPDELKFLCVTTIALISVPSSAWALDQGLSEPWAQWCFGLPAVLFGLAIHFAQLDRKKLCLVCFATICGWFATIYTSSGNWGFGSLILGINAAIMTFSVHFNSKPWMRWAAALSMPVYLSHPIFIAFLAGDSTIAGRYMTAILTILLSVIFGFAALKSSWGRKLL